MDGWTEDNPKHIMPPATAVAWRHNKRQQHFNSVSASLLRPESGTAEDILSEIGGDMVAGKLNISMLTGWSHVSSGKPR